MAKSLLSISGWERSLLAVETVRKRLRRAVQTLTQAKVAYAVVGGHAVAEWVGRIDQAAVRTTQDVDILLRRSDLEAAKQALESVGFVYRHAASIDMFLDGPDAKARDAVHIVFAKEKVRDEYLYPAPDVTQIDTAGEFFVLELSALAQMKLTSFRDKDRTHLRDMIDVGLLDASWKERLPEDLAQRLQLLLDTPEG